MTNVYRDGKVHVMAQKCKTCIFRPGNLMHLSPGVVAGMRRQADQDGGCIPCHSTLHLPDEAVCRGYYDRAASWPLRMAAAAGIVVEVEL